MRTPQTCPAHTRQRATGSRTLPACLSCVVMLCRQRHCRSTLQCVGKTACTQIAYTSAHCLLDCCHWLHLTALPPCTLPARLLSLVASHCTAAPRFIYRCPSRRKKQKLRGRSETSGLRLDFLHRVRSGGRGVCACVVLIVYAKVRGARHDLVLTWWCFSTYRNLATRGRSGIHGLENSADIEFCDHHEGSPFK